MAEIQLSQFIVNTHDNICISPLCITAYWIFWKMDTCLPWETVNSVLLNFHLRVCFYSFTICLLVDWRARLKVPFFQFVFLIISLLFLPFAAWWVHTNYSAFKVHSCETSCHTLYREDLAFLWNICEKFMLYLCFKYCISFVFLYLIPFCLLHLFTDCIVESLSQYWTFLISVAFVFV